MTIYKFASGEKKPEDNVDDTEVVADLLKSEMTEAPPVVSSVNIMYTTAMRRRRQLLYFLIALAVLTFIASAAIGVIYLCHHFSYMNRHTDGELGHLSTTHEAPVFRIGERPSHARYNQRPQLSTDDLLRKPNVYVVNYFDTPEEEAANRSHGYLQERVQMRLFADSYERIEVPQFDECASAVIVHDFIYNYTVIVDKENTRCFVMKLNRTLVAPPSDIIDLVRKIWSDHYIPKVRTLREKYLVFPRPVRNVGVFGKFVAAECRRYTTFKLIKYRDFFKKMVRLMRERHYGYYAFRENVIKIEVHS